MALTCETFSNRIFGCTYYKEENNYAKRLRLLLERIVTDYKSSREVNVSPSFHRIFVDNYNIRNGTTAKVSYKEDLDEFEDICLSSVEHLTDFFNIYNITNFLRNCKGTPLNY